MPVPNTRAPGALDAYEAPSTAEKLDEEASLAAVAGADALRAVKVAGVVLVGLLVCPPLAASAFVIVAPFLVVAVVVGLLVGIVSTPYLLFHHFRRPDNGHMSLLAHRLRGAARAVIDVAPHRIVADTANTNNT